MGEKRGMQERRGGSCKRRMQMHGRCVGGEDWGGASPHDAAYHHTVVFRHKSP